MFSQDSLIIFHNLYRDEKVDNNMHRKNIRNQGILGIINY